MSELLQAKYDNYITSANGNRWEARQPGVTPAKAAAWIAMAEEDEAAAKAIWMQIEGTESQPEATDSPSGLAAGGTPAPEPIPSPVVAANEDEHIPLSVTITSSSDWEEV